VQNHDDVKLAQLSKEHVFNVVSKTLFCIKIHQEEAGYRQKEV
jgi:hypothetical protein